MSWNKWTQRIDYQVLIIDLVLLLLLLIPTCKEKDQKPTQFKEAQVLQKLLFREGFRIIK